MGLRDKGVRSLADYQEAQPGELIEEIDPALVDEAPQIRTVFNPERDAEFAEILKRQGQQSAVILRPNPEQRGRYIVVYGHRRRRACIANQTMLKAVIRNITAEEAWVIQWSENIDRENLTALEIGRAIQSKQEELGSLSAVSELTGRTIAWLSKYRRFAEAYDAEGPAHDLIDSGVTVSVDTVTEVYSLQTRSEAGAQAAAQLVEEVRADPLIKVRDRVRELSDDAKEQDGKPRSKPRKEKPEAPADDADTPRSPKPSAAPGSINDLLMTVYMKLIEEKNGTVRKAMNAIGEEGKEKIERALKRFYSKGHTTTAADYSSVVVANLADGTFGQDGAGLFHMIAFMEGKLGEKDGFELSDILNKAKAQPADG